MPKNEDAFGLPPFLSPAILFMYMIDIEVLEEYIEYACHISEFTKNWDRYMILYNLMLAHKYDLIHEKYLNCAKNCGCNLNNEFEIQKFVHLQYIYNFGYIFGKT